MLPECYHYKASYNIGVAVDAIRLSDFGFQILFPLRESRRCCRDVSQLFFPVMIIVADFAGFTGGGVGAMTAGANLYGRKQDIGSLHAGRSVVAGDTSYILVCAMLEGAFG